MSAQGVIAQYLDDLRRKGGLKGSDIANIANVSPTMAARWMSGGSSPRPATQLVLSDLHYVVERLQDTYSAAEIRIWLFARHPQLEGERAVDMINDGRAEGVLAVLDRLHADADL